EELADFARLGNKRLRPGQRTAHGGAEAFGKANGDGVEMPGPFAGLDAGGHDGIPQPGAVEVHDEIVLPGPGADGDDLVDLENPAAATVAPALQADEPRFNQMIVDGPYLALELADVDDAVVAVDGPAGHAREHGRAADLELIDVAARLAEHLVAGLRVGLDADLVRHRAGGDEQCGFLAEEVGDFLLEPVDRRIFAEDIVAQLGAHHGGTHAGGGAGDGVAAEVDQVRHGASSGRIQAGRSAAGESLVLHPVAWRPGLGGFRLVC